MHKYNYVFWHSGYKYMWYTTNKYQQTTLTKTYFRCISAKKKKYILTNAGYIVLISPDDLIHNFKHLHEYPHKCCSFQAPFCGMFHGSNEHCIIESSLKRSHNISKSVYYNGNCQCYSTSIIHCINQNWALVIGTAEIPKIVLLLAIESYTYQWTWQKYQKENISKKLNYRLTSTTHCLYSITQKRPTNRGPNLACTRFPTGMTEVR